MAKLFMVVALIVVSATVGIANAQNVNVNGNKEPFVVEFNKLSSYLKLESYQLNRVFEINDYFVNQQRESMGASDLRQDKRLQNAVYCNLKLIKKTLTADQYRKYVTLLNVTNNNNRIIGTKSLSELYLADNE